MFHFILGALTRWHSKAQVKMKSAESEVSRRMSPGQLSVYIEVNKGTADYVLLSELPPQIVNCQLNTPACFMSQI